MAFCLQCKHFAMSDGDLYCKKIGYRPAEWTSMGEYPPCELRWGTNHFEVKEDAEFVPVVGLMNPSGLGFAKNAHKAKEASE